MSEKVRVQSQQIQVANEKLAEHQHTIEKLQREIEKLRKTRQPSVPKEADFSSQMSSFLEKPKFTSQTNNAASRLRAAWNQTPSAGATSKKVCTLHFCLLFLVQTNTSIKNTNAPTTSPSPNPPAKKAKKNPQDDNAHMVVMDMLDPTKRHIFRKTPKEVCSLRLHLTKLYALTLFKSAPHGYTSDLDASKTTRDQGTLRTSTPSYTPEPSPPPNFSSPRTNQSPINNPFSNYIPPTAKQSLFSSSLYSSQPVVSNPASAPPSQGDYSPAPPNTSAPTKHSQPSNPPPPSSPAVSAVLPDVDPPQEPPPLPLEPQLCCMMLDEDCNCCPFKQEIRSLTTTQDVPKSTIIFKAKKLFMNFITMSTLLFGVVDSLQKGKIALSIENANWGESFQTAEQKYRYWYDFTAKFLLNECNMSADSVKRMTASIGEYNFFWPSFCANVTFIIS